MCSCFSPDYKQAGRLLQDLGIPIKDAAGNLRPMGDLFNDLKNVFAKILETEEKKE